MLCNVLYDKGILNDEHSYFKAYHVKTEENGRIPFSSATGEEKKKFIAEWNDTVNESLATWNKEYWKKYQEAEQHQKDSKNTDHSRPDRTRRRKDEVQKQCSGDQTCQSSVCGEQKLHDRRAENTLALCGLGRTFAGV